MLNVDCDLRTFNCYPERETTGQLDDQDGPAVIIEDQHQQYLRELSPTLGDFPDFMENGAELGMYVCMYVVHKYLPGIHFTVSSIHTYVHMFVLYIHTLYMYVCRYHYKCFKKDRCMYVHTEVRIFNTFCIAGISEQDISVFLGAYREHCEVWK